MNKLDIMKVAFPFISIHDKILPVVSNCRIFKRVRFTANFSLQLKKFQHSVYNAKTKFHCLPYVGGIFFCSPNIYCA